MSNEEDFTGKFLMNMDRLTEFFRTGAITIKIDLKLEGLLEDITGRERPLILLQNLAASHYHNDSNIIGGFHIMLKQINDLREQLETINKGTDKKITIYFNSGEFVNGYNLVKERLRQILEKKQ